MTTKSFRARCNPVPSNANASTHPSATRSCGEIQLLSIEYFTKNAAARKRTNPPIHANRFTPMNLSQLIAGPELGIFVLTGGGSTRGGGVGGGGGAGFCGSAA